MFTFNLDQSEETSRLKELSDLLVLCIDIPRPQRLLEDFKKSVSLRIREKCWLCEIRIKLVTSESVSDGFLVTCLFIYGLMNPIIYFKEYFFKVLVRKQTNRSPDGKQLLPDALY